jgi:hypothetical protein
MMMMKHAIVCNLNYKKGRKKKKKTFFFPSFLKIKIYNIVLQYYKLDFFFAKKGEEEAEEEKERHQKEQCKAITLKTAKLFSQQRKSQRESDP